MEKLIIDTDPGVDDAQAILMAAAHPQAQIAAILVVGGNVGLEHTVRNSLAHFCGRFSGGNAFHLLLGG
jgi:inosine-uridine nucleoside N-ribohydrolase